MIHVAWVADRQPYSRSEASDKALLLAVRDKAHSLMGPPNMRLRVWEEAQPDPS